MYILYGKGDRQARAIISKICVMVIALRWVKSNYLVILILLLGLILRFSLSDLAFHDDLIVNASWGEWIYKNGPLHFFSNTNWPYSWPTQPPLIDLIYGFNFFLYDKLLLILSNIGFFIAIHRIFPTHFLWFFNFSRWFGTAKYLLTSFTTGQLITMKLVAILADMGVAAVVYYLAKPIQKTKSIYWLLLYLFVPFSFYISALWGQYDQLSFLFLIFSFLFLIKKNFYLSPILLLASIEAKPTSLIFVPLFIYLYFKQNPSSKTVIISAVSSVALFIGSLLVFSDTNFYNFIVHFFFKAIFQKSEYRVSTNAFNFWRIFIGNRAMNDSTVLFLLPTKLWGYGFFALLNALAFKVSQKATQQKIFQSLFIIGAGSWLFLTNMLDRYFFAGVVFLLIYTIYKSSLLKYWLILATIFILNLYNLWFYPIFFLKDLLLWNDSFLTRVLALVNVVIFIRVSWDILQGLDLPLLPQLKMRLRLLQNR